MFTDKFEKPSGVGPYQLTSTPAADSPLTGTLDGFTIHNGSDFTFDPATSTVTLEEDPSLVDIWLMTFSYNQD